MDGITNCMESIIIKKNEMMLELPLHERQKAYFQDLLNAAKPVKIVPRLMYWRITNWTTYGT